MELIIHEMSLEEALICLNVMRQRASIARVFLKYAPIILLDEATASLDVENETVIQSALPSAASGIMKPGSTVRSEKYCRVFSKLIYLYILRHAVLMLQMIDR